MINNKSKIKLVIFFCVLTVFLVGYFSLANAQKKKSNLANAAANHEMEVTVITVKNQEVQAFQELPARVSAYKISEVRPQADGIIRKQLFEEGSFVKAGEALYQVDASLYQAEYESAHAKLKTAGLKKSRYEHLLKVNAISKQDYDDAMADFVQAQSEVKKANIRLDYAKIYAPISGYVGKSNFTEGALVVANQAQILTTIAQLDPIFVDITLPTRDLMKIGDQKDIPVSIFVDGVEYENNGVLKFSEVFADESTDSVRLRAKFCNSSKKLLPGMFVNVRLHLKPTQAVTVPQRATNRAPDGNLMVWTVDKENIVKAKPIKVSQALGSDWIVSEGLEDGEIVVYEGFQKISDGMKVKTVFLESSVPSSSP